MSFSHAVLARTVSSPECRRSRVDAERKQVFVVGPQPAARSSQRLHVKQSRSTEAVLGGLAERRLDILAMTRSV